MKILYLTDILPKMTSGPANAVPLRIAAQAKFDDVFWLNTNDFFQWQSQDYQFDFGEEWKTRSLADVPFEPDIIVFQGVYQWLKKSNYPKDARRKNIPYVILPHSQLNLKSRDTKFLFLVVGSPRQFEVFITHAKAVQFFSEEQKAESSFFNAPTIIITNGISPQKQIIRSFQNKCNALFIGRFAVNQKGLDLLFETLANEKETLTKSKFHLDMYGVGTVDFLFDKFPVQDLVTIHAPVFGEKKDSAFRSADMFILPSRFEGQSVALLEALSYSLPVLTTTACNMQREIESTSAGYVATPSVDNITEKLLSFLRNMPNDYETMSNAAFNLSKHYYWNEIAANTHDIYSSLLN